MRRFFPFILLFTTLFAEAQNTMYFMDRLPQNIAYNPAIIPKMDFFMNMPGAGFSAQLYNSGFSFNELDDFASNLDNENYNPDKFVQSIGDYNLFSAEASMNVASFGFKLKEKNFLSFSFVMNTWAMNKASSEIAYLLADLDDLTPEDFPLEINDISFEGNVNLNLGVTYAHAVNKHLTLGITPRISFNQAGIKTTDLNYSIDYNDPDINPSLDEYEQTFTGEALLGLPTKINQEIINSGKLDGDAGLLEDNWENDISAGSLLQNKSLMLDIGATYEIAKWTFSASLINLGSSTYKTNAYELKGNNDKVLVKELDEVKIGIPVKFYAGAMRQFSPQWNYAILFNNNFYSTGPVTSATASLNGYVGSALSTSISYTVGNKFNDLGIGLRLRFFPGTDLYFVTDNIVQAMNYKNAFRLTAAAGINIAIGVKDKNLLPEITPEETN